MRITNTRTDLIIILPLLLLLMSCGSKDTFTQSPAAHEKDPTENAPLGTTQEDVPSTTNTLTNSVVEKLQSQPNADVIYVRAVKVSDGFWTFYVTVSHPDTGWDDYADGWDILTPDGFVLKNNPDDPFTRLLAHPHVDEQPFTRSQSNIIIPEDVNQVLVRAHDIVSGFGGQEISVDLTLDSGPGFEVEP